MIWVTGLNHPSVDKEMTIMTTTRIGLLSISASLALSLTACSQQTSLGSQLLGDKTSRAVALPPLKKIITLSKPRKTGNLIPVVLWVKIRFTLILEMT